MIFRPKNAFKYKNTRKTTLLWPKMELSFSCFEIVQKCVSPKNFVFLSFTNFCSVSQKFYLQFRKNFAKKKVCKGTVGSHLAWNQILNVPKMALKAHIPRLDIPNCMKMMYRPLFSTWNFQLHLHKENRNHEKAWKWSIFTHFLR